MIKIVHLYYDLLNLYGENGNILAIKDYLENNKIDYQIDFKTINENIKFNDYDLIYVGSGTEENILLCINDLNKYQKDLKKYLADNKYIIATGNANILFGNTYTTLNKEVIKCTQLFNYDAKETPFRTVGEQLYKDQNNQKIIGFLNHQVAFKNYDSNLFKVIHGNGYHPHKHGEGFNYKNFYGTLLIGPFLIRNPYFTQKLIDTFLKEHQLTSKNYINKNSIKAYETYLKLFYK
ncbi:MAG: hypothetical protein J5892_04340 [Bacilli bacterium]|nr:hypothetical protein [Bacilli bacterium]